MHKSDKDNDAKEPDRLDAPPGIITENNKKDNYADAQALKDFPAKQSDQGVIPPGVCRLCFEVLRHLIFLKMML
jgi:hypothetical protein